MVGCRHGCECTVHVVNASQTLFYCSSEFDSAVSFPSCSLLEEFSEKEHRNAF